MCDTKERDRQWRIYGGESPGIDENAVRVVVPKQDDRATDEGPCPVTVDVAMDPTTTTTAKSTVSNSGQYTYRVSDHDGGATTEPSAAAAAATVEKIELLDSRETGRARDENGDGGGPDDWLLEHRGHDDNRVDDYFDGDYDDHGAVQVRPPMPVSLSSAAGRFCSFRGVVANTVLVTYLVVTFFHATAYRPN